jgi:hypothetical protein
MSRSLRLSEKWFHRALWLIAMIFAGFLIGLGSLVVGDLPKIEQPLLLESFIDKPQARTERVAITDLERKMQDEESALEQAQLVLQAAQNRSASARETFANWIATRRATAQSAQDAEIIQRTRELDAHKLRERRAEERVETLRQAQFATEKTLQQHQQRLQELTTTAQQALYKAERRRELKVFLARLALTLPLLVIAGWLLARKRKSAHWPFVWGFVFFALFAFFVELVPYLPSYGGYVRYIVGIVLTVVVGHYAIRALQRYLEKQKAAEQRSEQERRTALSYDLAQNLLAKRVCPGCERPVDLTDTTRNFCVHCGICLYNECPACHARKNAFAHYCHACGAQAVLSKD